MIKSMTGYGRGETQGDISFVVEIRSLNRKFLEVYVRLPRPWLLLEEKIKKKVQQKISRGRVDIFINMTGDNFPMDIEIDKVMAKNYYNKLVELCREAGFEGPISLSLLSLIPDIFKIQESFPNEDELWQRLEPALDTALKNLVIMREHEGQNLWHDIYHRLKKIKKLILSIKDRAEVMPKEYKDRLIQNLGKISEDILIDEERVYAEIALLAEKSSITEELVRLNSHIDQMVETATCSDSVGKKMDFIAQEMFREINTIGAKSQDFKISRDVIEVKSQLEKIREQIQNIE